MKKIKLTRPELKRYRDAMQRFERYLPMLKLKQQQLQLTVRKVQEQYNQARDELHRAERRFEPYSVVLADRAGIDVRKLAEPLKVNTTTLNIAGVNVPVFKNVEFSQAKYSLFATPAWVDSALADLKGINQHKAQADVLGRQYQILQKELTKIVQRVNLFEKVKIPESREAIRVIRIKLGDEMTAAVGRAKIAKGKLVKTERPTVREHVVEDTAA